MATMNIQLDIPNTMAWTKDELVAAVKSFVSAFVMSRPTAKVQNEANEASVDDIFGVWSDANYPSADEICRFLKEERTSTANRDAKFDAAWL